MIATIIMARMINFAKIFEIPNRSVKVLNEESTYSVNATEIESM